MKFPTYPHGHRGMEVYSGWQETPKGAALRRLQAIGSGDPEAAHSQADEVLCDLLRQLGHDDVVEAWDAVPKWYA